jgi:hypothetical protein
MGEPNKTLEEQIEMAGVLKACCRLLGVKDWRELPAVIERLKAKPVCWELLDKYFPTQGTRR